MNITLDLLKLVADKLRERANEILRTSPYEGIYSDQADVLEDAADALDDARDLLEDLG